MDVSGAKRNVDIGVLVGGHDFQGFTIKYSVKFNGVL